MSQDLTPVESILALECGSTTTQAFLIDQVAGEYRLVVRTEAPSTVEPPWNNVATSVRQAVNEISEITGWPLLNERGHIISPQRHQGGVDAVVMIASASNPLRLVVAGVMRDISLLSARRALSTTYAIIEGVISLDRQGNSARGNGSDIQGQIDLLQQLEPDAVVIVGGIDGATNRAVLQAAEAVALANVTTLPGERPPILYAGNAQLRAQVAEIVGTETELRAVDNVRPSLHMENLGPLQTEGEELYVKRKMERLPGFATVSAWSSVSILPAAKAFAYAVQYLARLDGINVLGVDAGGATVTAAAMVDDRLELIIRSDLGLSYNANRLLDQVPVQSISRWLPVEVDPNEIRNLLHNKTIRYRTVPQTPQELLIEQAVTREMLRLTVGDLVPHWSQGASRLYPNLLPKFHLIVGGGGALINTPNYGQAALMLLDALQPIGVAGLALDKVRMMAALSAVAMVNPAAAAQLMERDALLNLGTVVAPAGMAREGEIALILRIEYEDGRQLEVEVPFGALEVIPLPAGQTANLELRPTRRFDVGLGTRGQAGTTKVEGGILGIIIDARGRPLPTAQDPEEQRERMQRWFWDMGS